MGKLEGKVAIVTGAGQGMGSAIAHSLAQQGASVVVNDMNETTAEATVSDIKSYNPKVISYVGNVTDIHDVQQMIEHTESHFGHIDVLVNNAGVLRPTPLLQISEEEWDYVVEGNLKSTFLCSKDKAKHWFEFIQTGNTKTKTKHKERTQGIRTEISFTIQTTKIKTNQII